MPLSTKNHLSLFARLRNRTKAFMRFKAYDETRNWVMISKTKLVFRWYYVIMDADNSLYVRDHFSRSSNIFFKLGTHIGCPKMLKELENGYDWTFGVGSILEKNWQYLRVGRVLEVMVYFL